MSDVKVWNYMGVTLRSALICAGGLLAICFSALPYLDGLRHPSKVSLSDIGCPSGMEENMLVGRCMISLQAATAIAYAAEDAGEANKLNQLSAIQIRGLAQSVTENSKKRFKLFHLAALMGDAESQFIVGGLFSKGDGVEEDDLEALRWLHESGINGYRKAQLRLAYMLATGEFVEKDDAQAVQWLGKAEKKAEVRTAKAEGA